MKKKSHGGKRKGAGRKTAEKKTANLCGVRLAPSTLERYQNFARSDNMLFSTWVEMYLQEGHWLLPAGERALFLMRQLKGFLEGDADVDFDMHAVKDVILSLSESLARCRKFQEGTHANVRCPHCLRQHFAPKNDDAIIVCHGCHQIFSVKDAAK